MRRRLKQLGVGGFIEFPEMRLEVKAEVECDSEISADLNEEVPV